MKRHRRDERVPRSTKNYKEEIEGERRRTRRREEEREKYVRRGLIDGNRHREASAYGRERERDLFFSSCEENRRNS